MPTMIKSLLLPLLFAPLAAYGTILTDIVNTRPADPYISNDTSNSNSAWKNNGSAPGGRRDLGQTFRLPETIILTQIVLKVYTSQTGAQNAPFSLSILPFANESALEPSGAALYTDTGILPSPIITDNQYLVFTLTEPLTLQAGQYGFLLSFPDMASGRLVSFYTGTGTSYSGGVGFFYTDEGVDQTMIYKSAGGANGADFNFSLYAAPVPEPASVAFVLTGAGALLLWRMRRRQSSNRLM